MPQLDFNLFFSDFFWLVVSLIFFYIFFLFYILPMLLKILVIRKFLINYYNIKLIKLNNKLLNLSNLINSKKKLYLKAIFSV